MKPFHTAALAALLIFPAASAGADEQAPASKGQRMITYPAPKKASPVCLYDGKPYTAGAVRGDQICYWSQADGFHEAAPFWQKRAAWQR